MSLVSQTPPRWAEILLEQLLAARDQEAVAGDLREEYVESIAPQRGRLSADLWYLRQVSSFLPKLLFQGGPMKKTLLCISFFTFTSACWLTVMEIVLRHTGYLLRIGASICIALISLATIFMLIANSRVRSERWLWVGAVVLIGIGGQAFFRNARAAHFEGFVFLISTALLLQGALMLLSCARRRGQDPDLPGPPA